MGSRNWEFRGTRRTRIDHRRYRRRKRVYAFYACTIALVIDNSHNPRGVFIFASFGVNRGAYLRHGVLPQDIN